MLSRTYVVVMAPVDGGDPTAPVDILVQNDPGSVDARVTTADGAIYYEWRGRPIRFETVAADGAAGGFVPRARLGCQISVTCLGAGNPAAVPAVKLSASLSSVVDDVFGAPFADPNGMPAIRLASATNIASIAYLVSLQIPDAKDDEITGMGV